MPWLNAALVTAVAGAVSWRIAARTGNRVVRAAVVSSFVVVMLIAVVLFVASAYHWPFLEPLQLGNGFWTFAWDAPTYHTVALEMTRSLAQGTPFPERDPAEYFFFTALVYLVFGPHPLTAIALNALGHAIIVVSMFALAQRLFGPTSATVAAVLVAFWPSLVLWSSQLLRETLSLMLLVVLIEMATCHVLGERAAAGGEAGRRGARVRWWLVFGALVFALLGLRWYLVWFLAVGLLVATPVAAVAAPSRRQRVRRTLTLVAVIVAVTLLGFRIDAARLIAVVRAGTVTSQVATTPTSVGARMTSSTPWGALDAIRQGSVRAGGTLVDPEVRLRTLGETLRYVPRALAVLALFPPPSEWVKAGRTTGIFVSLAGLEELLVYGLLPLFAIGLVAAEPWRRTETAMLAALVVVAAVIIALMLANMGTMFRLRLAAIVPALVFAGHGAVRVMSILRRRARG